MVVVRRIDTVEVAGDDSTEFHLSLKNKVLVSLAQSFHYILYSARTDAPADSTPRNTDYKAFCFNFLLTE
jgi:hypothetical protein